MDWLCRSRRDAWRYQSPCYDLGPSSLTRSVLPPHATFMILPEISRNGQPLVLVTARPPLFCILTKGYLLYCDECRDGVSEVQGPRSKVQGTAQTELLSGIWFAPLRRMPSEISLGEAPSRSNFTVDVNALKVGLLSNCDAELAVEAAEAAQYPCRHVRSDLGCSAYGRKLCAALYLRGARFALLCLRPWAILCSVLLKNNGVSLLPYAQRSMHQ